MNNRIVMYDNVNKHLSELMTERQHILYPSDELKDTINEEDLERVPLIEKAIDEGRKFYQPIK